MTKSKEIILQKLTKSKEIIKQNDIKERAKCTLLLIPTLATWRSNPGNLFATVSLRQILLSRMNGAHELCAAIPFINKKQLIV